MIDTVILTIPVSHTWIQEPDKFQPSLRGLKDVIERGLGARLFAKYTYNMPKSEGYYPRLTVTLRWDKGYQLFLKIEFSIPKLLFGNSLDEVEDKDFDEVVNILKNKLSEMGIRIFTEQLKNALVSAIHYSKNILLSKPYTASMVIKNLGKLDVTKRLELNHRHFQNEGHALYFDSGSYQIVIYDKIKDLAKTNRHSVDKDKTSKQLDLFNYLKENKIPLEVLRLEVRLTKKTKLNSLFRELGFVTNPTFEQVFSKDKAQSVVSHYWNFITQDKNLFMLRFSDTDLLKQVIDFQKLSGKKLSVIETLGLAQIITYSKEFGLRNLRNTLCTHYSERTWFRLNKFFNLIEQITSQRDNFGFINDIEQALLTFEPYRTKSEGEHFS